MHLRSSALWTSFALCFIVRRVGGIPVAADRPHHEGFHSPEQDPHHEGSHSPEQDLHHEGSHSPEQHTAWMDNLKTFRALSDGVDYEMTIQNGSEVIRLGTRRGFISLGQMSLDRWGEQPTDARNIEIWPNNIRAPNDGTIRVFEYLDNFKFVASLARRDGPSPHCPEHNPCIGQLLAGTETSIDFGYIVKSPATGKQVTIKLNSQILVIGFERIPRVLKLVLEDLWNVALSCWKGEPLTKKPLTKNSFVVNETDATDNFDWKQRIKILIAGSFYCPPDDPCSGEFDSGDRAWTVTSPIKGEIRIGQSGTNLLAVLAVQPPPHPS
ncbi:hypothetical protein EV360DRAFT_81943 [Lentinula raphanica]|nr:hypothetical protein EV360DRAFT_81943 [Lentinula raphanica]